MNLTDEQVAIIDRANTGDNLLINACAGCGKTSTLELLEKSTQTKPIAYLVFNTKNAKEAEDRMLSTTTVRTFNSLGHRIWARTQGRNLTLNPKKPQAIFKQLTQEVKKDAASTMWSVYFEVIAGVNLARALGYVPEGKFPSAKRLIGASAFHAALEETPDDLVADLIDAVLTRSIKAAYDGTVDYNDQIYMPALFGGTYPQFPLVLVDESQDLSPVNHAMLDRLCKHRVIAVGDPWQNIYGFRGALAGGMSNLQATYEMTPLDLSVSFRCPEAIVCAAQWRVPHFKWTKPGGHVELLDRLDLASFPDDCAIICRNNAPIFRLGMQLLSSGRAVSVAGSDIGPKLIGLMRRLGHDDTSRGAVLEAIDGWLAEREAKGSATAGDLAECMRVFARHGATLAQAISYAEHLFAQRGTIKLLTGHKSKGLEFDTVYHLDPWLLREDEQDLNLRYVIQTRSADAYYEIDSRAIQ